MKKAAAMTLVGLGFLAAASVIKENKSVDTGNNDIADPAPKTMMADTAPESKLNSAPAQNFTIV